MKKITGFVIKHSSISLILLFVILISLVFIFSNYTIFVIDWIRNNMLVVATMFLGLITYFYYRTSRRTMWHQALLEFQKEYRPTDMMKAVRELHNYYRKTCGNIEESKKEGKLREDFRKLIEKNEDCSENINRRKVEYFFLHLAILYKRKILTGKIIFDMFSERDLRIIPKIIIPLSQELQNYVDEKDSIEPTELKGKKIMLKLYEDSKI